MAEPVTLDRDSSAVLIMDFQIRIVNNVASDPQGVVERAAQVLQGARQAGIPIIYVVHRGGVPVPGEAVITKMKPGSFSTTDLDIILREIG
jgi:nicotinamidase-related amidase